jgi:hypothetical protein
MFLISLKKAVNPDKMANLDMGSQAVLNLKK